MKTERTTNHDSTTRTIIHDVSNAILGGVDGCWVKAGMDWEADGGPTITIEADGRKFELRLMEIE